MVNRRIVERISPVWLGIGISGSLLVIFLVTETLLGRWDALLAGGEVNPFARVSTGILRDVRIAIVHCLLMGYVPAAFLYAMRSGRRTVFLLQGALGCSPEECESLASSVRLSAPGLITSGLIGITLGFLTPYISLPLPESPWSPSTWDPEVVWHRILAPVLLVCLCWLAYAVVTVSSRMSRLAKRLDRIDLLDLSSLTPFTRLGLSNALLVVGVLSIFSLMLIETGLRGPMLLIGGPTLIVAALALLLPVRGVHQRIRQSKEAELRRINGAIATRRSMFENTEADHRRGELADLVAYRGLIEDVPEWPFTTSTYARLVLYMLIPAVSWGLGIFAEEIVGRALF